MRKTSFIRTTYLFLDSENEPADCFLQIILLNCQLYDKIQVNISPLFSF